MKDCGYFQQEILKDKSGVGLIDHKIQDYTVRSHSH